MRKIRRVTFQILGVFREIDISRPPNEPLIRPDQRIRVDLLALVSPDGERLSQKHEVSLERPPLAGRNYVVQLVVTRGVEGASRARKAISARVTGLCCA